MKQVFILIVVAAASVGATSPLLAQKSAPVITRDTDRDGVPDIRDRCRNTPPGTRVGETGCPLPAAEAARPAAIPAAVPGPVVTQPVVGQARGTDAANPRADSAARAARADSLARTARADSLAARARADSIAARTRADSAARAALADSLMRSIRDSMVRAARADSVARALRADSLAAAARTDSLAAAARADSARRAAAAPPVPVRRNLTAGFAMLPGAGETEAERLEYARDLALRLDSAILGMIDIFRNTTGSPLPGAGSPDVLASREKNRWQRCRLVYFDLQTYEPAVDELAETAPNPTVERALRQLGESLRGLEAVRECDNVSSMIEAPARWQPWGPSYEQSARAFYQGWYRQLRALHEADRTYVRALNGVLPAGRGLELLSALPTNPPTLGSR